MDSHLYAFRKEEYMDERACRFRVRYHYDNDRGAPWETDAAYIGLVSNWERRSKYPGELILADTRDYRRFYNWQEAMARARAANRGGGQSLADGVMADYQRLCAWFTGGWHYMGIVACPLTRDYDELHSQSDSLWGLESDGHPDYIEETVRELLREVGATGAVYEVEVR